MSKSLAIDLIDVEAGTQMRSGTRLETIEEYSELYTGKKDWPFKEPIVVFTNGESYWLADGFHRLEAAKSVARVSAQCDIKKGSLEDAQDYALSANKNHGLRRSNEDKRRAVEFALSCPRWAKKSDRMIAKHVGVGNKFVGDIRKQLCSEHSCDEREGADGKVRKVPERQKSEVIPVVEPTEEAEFEYDYRDESEPLEVGEEDCGIVDEDSPDWVKSNHVLDFKKQLTALMRTAKDIPEGPGTESFATNRKRILLDLGNVKSTLLACTPHKTCPYCCGLCNDCDGCNDRGWVDEMTFKNAPKEMKDAVEGLSSGGDR